MDRTSFQDPVSVGAAHCGGLQTERIMESELLSSQVTAGYAVAALMEWLKNKPWFPFAVKDAVALNRATSFVFAFVSAISIHLTFDSVEAGGLMIRGLTIWNLAHAGWATIQQFGLQQYFYKSVIRETRQCAKPVRPKTKRKK